MRFVTDLVVVEQLSKRYPGVDALAGIDLSISQGEVFGIIGPNGAGKTTLIRAIVGALRPSGGRARVFGLDPLSDRWSLRARIGYMPQQPALYSDLSVRRNVEFFGAAHDVPHTRVHEVIRLVDLVDRADDAVHMLSGGMQQRVSLACAVVHEPDLLLLDEPTAGVDPELRATFWGWFRRLADAGSTVVISTTRWVRRFLAIGLPSFVAGDWSLPTTQRPSCGPPGQRCAYGRARTKAGARSTITRHGFPSSPLGPNESNWSWSRSTMWSCG